eukprot:bmy_03358T0
MAQDRAKPCELNQEKYDADDNMKIICQWDSTMGKSKFMERFFIDGFQPQQLSTYTLTLYKHMAMVGSILLVSSLWTFWTQQARSSSRAHMPPTARPTPTSWCLISEESHLQEPEHLGKWGFGSSGQRSCASDIKVTPKIFSFAQKFSLLPYFVSTADGTNGEKLSNDAVQLAVS